MTDVIRVEILEDGTISITTDSVSGTNHVSADKLLKDIAKLAGGTVTTTKRVKTGVRAHEHHHHHHHH